MKLFGCITATVAAQEILRQPNWWEKVRKAFGDDPNLGSGQAQSALEATVLVEVARDALRSIGASNAISLVIDDTVLFHDRDGASDDMGDLFLAFHDNSSVFGEGFREIRLAVEHEEAGIHIVIEIQARGQHAVGVPAVRIIISGRAVALTPKRGEDAEDYRKRAEPFANNPQAIETMRVQFQGFVARLRDAVASAMPTGTIEVADSDVRIARPSKTALVQRDEVSPGARNYDPYNNYYPAAAGSMMIDAMIWSTVFSAMHTPHYVVVDHHNHVQGRTDDPGIEAGPTVDPSQTEAGDWGQSEAQEVGDSSGDASSSDGGDYGTSDGGDFGGDFGGID
jgi:hypothetical protein